MQRNGWHGVWRGLAAAGLVLLAALPARAFAPAAGDAPSLCLAAAQKASRATGVPLEVLMAISLTESGRKADGRFSAWPWTLNIAGKGFFLPDNYFTDFGSDGFNDARDKLQIHSGFLSSPKI